MKVNKVIDVRRSIVDERFTETEEGRWKNSDPRTEIVLTVE